MDRFVKNFIAMSIVYFVIASLFGIWMLWMPSLVNLRFVHSHLMMLGWVSMMIYGVGYHILPRFAGKLLKSRMLGEVHFWLSNIGLSGMVVSYILMQMNPSKTLYGTLTGTFGVIQGFSIFIFFYNIMFTVFGKEKAQA
ncbi:MAG: hypothetical protein HY805_09280 [Nitrospirae bacterium]|nr:hypothetical protein [Nitrospirota bacterium]